MGRCFNRIARMLRLTVYSDTQCGFKGFTQEAAELCFSRQTIEGFGFDAEILYIAAKHGLRIVELPVNWYNSPQSKVNPLFDASRMFLDLLVVLKNNRTGRYD
jgi:dolichyl-phosphate beta-glucosyltransferase